MVSKEFREQGRLISRTVESGAFHPPVFGHGEEFCGSRIYYHDALSVPSFAYRDVVIQAYLTISLENSLTRASSSTCPQVSIFVPCRNRCEIAHAERKTLVLMSISETVVERPE